MGDDIAQEPSGQAPSTVDGCVTLTFYTYWSYNMSKIEASMTTPQPDIPQGTLDMLILKVVSAGPIHGYAIAQRIQQISKEVLLVHQGSLYPALHRLEKRKLLQAEWKTSETGREAKFYRLTHQGRKQLELEQTNWVHLRDAIELIMRGREGAL
jgi:transcriptional regulator